jgi:hypothetical protein
MSSKVSEIDIKSSEINPNDEKDYRCAPTKMFKDGSCIPLHILVDMAEAYNKENSSDPIKLDSTRETLVPNKYKRYLVKQFKTKLNSVCNDQRCWTKQKFIKRMKEQLRDELQNNTFRPKGPDKEDPNEQGKFEWLNTKNIDQVMKQYEAKYQDFRFLGAVPYDFDELPAYGIKDMDFKKLVQEGIKKIGIIFNTDKHYEPGQHWISLFADLDKGYVYFSDSNGDAPDFHVGRKEPKRITNLMKDIANFIKNEGKRPVVDYNKLRHQHGGDACGVYSINFILRLLRGDSFKELTTKRLSDEKVNECRKFYFT